MENGTKVRIFSGDKEKYLGIGKYIGSDGNMPKFKIKNKIYLGCEIWWIKLSESKKFEEQYNKAVIRSADLKKECLHKFHSVYYGSEWEI
jgi:hypothetical protein